MNMEAISSQLLARYSFDRSSAPRDEAVREESRTENRHDDHRVRHAHHREQAGEIDSSRQHEDIHRLRRPRQDDSGMAGALTYRRSERTALLLETQEGDTVRMKIRAVDTLAVNQAQEESDGNTVSEFELEARSRTRIAIRVNGDLNEQELAAIQSVIQQAGAMAEDFFGGDTEEAFARASELEIDASQLANVRIRMRTTEQLTYPMGGALPLAGERPLIRSGAPASGEPESGTPSAGSTPVSTNDSVSGGPAAVSPGGETEAAGNGSESDGDDANVAEPGNTEGEVAAFDREQMMANVLQSIGDFLGRLFEAFSGSDESAESVQAPADMTFKLQVFRSMILSISEMETQQEQDPATELAAETVDAINAQAAPLEEVA